MTAHGTPLTNDDLIDLGGLFLRLASRGIVPNREIKRYVERHLEETESLLREVFTKPGRRVLQIDRGLSVVAYDDEDVLTSQDERAATVTEVDLSLVRFIPRKEVSLSKHRILDAYVAERFAQRHEDLPPAWFKLDKYVFFTGTEYKNRKISGRPRYPVIAFASGYYPPAGCVETMWPLFAEESNYLVAVLLID